MEKITASLSGEVRGDKITFTLDFTAKEVAKPQQPIGMNVIRRLVNRVFYVGSPTALDSSTQWS